jgi:hypothetical protein
MCYRNMLSSFSNFIQKLQRLWHAALDVHAPTHDVLPFYLMALHIYSAKLRYFLCVAHPQSLDMMLT